MSDLVLVLFFAWAVPPAVLLLTAARSIRRRWLIVRVKGDSMLPALSDGDVILVRRAPRRVIARGDIVVFQRPVLRGRPRPYFPAGPGSGRLMVKRVIATPGDRVPYHVRHWAPGAVTVPDDSLVVFGDNGGLDSRTFGLLPSDRVVGVFARPLTGRTR